MAGAGKLVERVVVGVFGNKQHGKDTVTALIMEEMAKRSRKSQSFALADPLKEAAVALLGMPPEIAWGTGIPTQEREHLRLTWTKYGKNARQWLQWVGTELGRVQINEDVWLDRAVDRVVMDSDGTQVFVISDCRFHNEREKLREKLAGRFIKFFRMKVYRPGIPIDMSHPSESEVANMPESAFELVIDNDAGLPELAERVRAACDTIEVFADLGVGD